MFGKSASLINIEKLTKRSSKILSVFQETIEGLNTVNAEVDDNINFRKQEIARLSDENEQLSKIKEDNQKVIGKISVILN